MKIPYLGKLNLHWCMKCNVPVLGKKCMVCNSRTKKVGITPPGDVRPAFRADVELINETIKRQFGVELIPEDKVAILNKTSGYDRFDEVIVDGEVIGVLKYDIKRLSYEFMPKLEGARRIWEKVKAKFVEIDESAEKFILKGASVLIPGVVGFDEDIKEDEEVIVVCKGRVIAVGRSKISGREAKKREKGMFIKTRKCKKPERAKILQGGQDWKLVIKANAEILRNYEREAMEFIKKVSEEAELPKVVAFSGGKDSLVTLLLVRKAIGDVEVMFTDTGLEFPETIKYMEKSGLNLLTRDSGDNFWKGVEYFGAPGRDYRWCCKVCKLGPTTQLILENFPQGCLSFIGQRKYESEVRARSSRIWKNPWIPVQVGASPIQHWTSLHIWLYLMQEGVEVNELYERGMERIGCWSCPSSDLAEFEIVKKIHPRLWKKWEEELREAGIRENEIKHGFWRWRKLSKGQKKLAAELKLHIEERNKKRFEYNLCKRNGVLSVSGALENLDFDRTLNLAKIFGEVKINKDHFEINGIAVYKNGKFEFNAGGEKGAKKIIKRIYGIAERAKHCFGCGVCLGQCKNNAIELREGKTWITDKCASCQRCHNRCSIIRYSTNNTEFMKV